MKKALSILLVFVLVTLAMQPGFAQVNNVDEYGSSVLSSVVNKLPDGQETITTMMNNKIIYTIKDRMYTNGDHEVEISDGTNTSKAFRKYGENYIELDGRRIELSIVENVSRILEPSMTSSAANWIWINQQTLTAEVRLVGDALTVVALSAILTTTFQLFGTIAVGVATTIVSLVNGLTFLDCARTTYGNSYVMNHYKYVDKYYKEYTSSSNYLTSKTWYNPPIY